MHKEKTAEQRAFEEAWRVLNPFGQQFTNIEVWGLMQVRHRARIHPDCGPSDHRRLEFIRWLVATGRLTDQVA
jgi:hypothetical protein